MKNKPHRSVPLLLAILSLALPTLSPAEIQILRVETIARAIGMPGPGSLATIYCTGLEGITGLIEASSNPLPTTLAGVRISFGAEDAPLLAIKDVRTAQAAYQQINFQVPYGRTAAPTLIQGNQSAPIPTDPAPWGQFFPNPQHASDYRPVTADDPPKAGEWIIAFGTNFGPVDAQLQSGYAAPPDRLIPLSNLLVGRDLWNNRIQLETVRAEYSLEIGFVGLAPGRVGVYQFNFRMPDPLPPGPAWISFKRIANCGERFSPGCGTGLITLSTDYWRLY
jgi:uncharacterized protein (TIGR03437 family)